MFKDVIKKIKKSKKIAIFNHINPDGDAHGSAFGLKLALLSLGKEAEVFLRPHDKDTKEFALMKGTDASSLEVPDCDLKIAVDCADIERLGAFKDVFDGETVAIDHHITHKPFAKTSLVVPKAPATGEIVADLIDALKITLTHDIAYNLYLAIVSDTGNFKFSSTTPHTHLVAAKLMETGINFSDMTKKLFDTKSPEYLELYKKAIENLEFYCDKKVSLLYISEDDFKNAGILEADADSIVALPGSVEGVEIGVYIRQRQDSFKVSLRSSGRINVADIAAFFGGGGHERASGFSLPLSIEEVKKAVIAEISNAINGVSK